MSASRALLGAILTEPRLLRDAAVLRLSDLSGLPRRVLTEMRDLAEQDIVPDLPTVATRLDGGAYAVELAEWTSGAAAPTNVKLLAGEIAATAERRRIRDALTDALRSINAEVATEHVVAELCRELEAVGSNGHSYGLLLRRCADIEAQAVRWVWPARIPLGKLSLLVGDPGLGKSLITLDMAARVTTGKAWPDGAPNEEPGSVVLLSAEDDAADTIRPRLEAAGADLERVHILEAVRDEDGPRTFSLAADLLALEAAIARLGDVRLVVLDPISAYTGGADTHINSEVRGMLAPLAALASRCGAAVLAVSHLNKGSGAAVYRTSGSIAFVAAARAVWAVGADPDDESGRRRLMLPTKNNLAPDNGGLAFQIEGDGSVTVAWGEQVAADATDVLSAGDPAERSEIVEAKDFLQDFLQDGPRAAPAVLRAARESGCSERTLRRAKRALGVRSIKSAEGWTWGLPTQDGQGGQDSHPGHLGNDGSLETAEEALGV